MGPNAMGRCAEGGCHSSSNECGSASGTFNWLTQQGYLDGSTSPPLTQSGSCLKLYSGGNMPKGSWGSGSTSQFKADLEAWAAAGAQNN